MPFTHSLLSSVLWGAGGYVLGRFFWKDSPRVAWGMAAVIASNWFLDLPVHTFDLHLWSGESFKFGLWNYKYQAFIFEGILLAIGT